jgi:hypothetical protein
VERPAAAPQLARLSARQVVEEIGRRIEVGAGNAYAMAVCLRELSRPERYRGELGFSSFEALLAAHDIGGVRATATSARLLRDVLRRIRERRTRPDTKVAKSAARRLRTAFRHIRVAGALRVHVHHSLACVAAHFGDSEALRLVEYLRAARRARVGPT